MRKEILYLKRSCFFIFKWIFKLRKKIHKSIEQVDTWIEKKSMDILIKAVAL